MTTPQKPGMPQKLKNLLAEANALGDAAERMLEDANGDDEILFKANELIKKAYEKIQEAQNFTDEFFCSDERRKASVAKLLPSLKYYNKK